jgi:hypothetical protein
MVDPRRLHHHQRDSGDCGHIHLSNVARHQRRLMIQSRAARGHRKGHRVAATRAGDSEAELGTYSASCCSLVWCGSRWGSRSFPHAVPLGVGSRFLPPWIHSVRGSTFPSDSSGSACALIGHRGLSHRDLCRRPAA